MATLPASDIARAEERKKRESRDESGPVSLRESGSGPGQPFRLRSHKRLPARPARFHHFAKARMGGEKSLALLRGRVAEGLAPLEPGTRLGISAGRGLALPGRFDARFARLDHRRGAR